jgi:hypothetical protein
MSSNKLSPVFSHQNNLEWMILPDWIIFYVDLWLDPRLSQCSVPVTRSWPLCPYNPGNNFPDSSSFRASTLNVNHLESWVYGAIPVKRHQKKLYFEWSWNITWNLFLVPIWHTRKVNTWTELTSCNTTTQFWISKNFYNANSQ